MKTVLFYRAYDTLPQRLRDSSGCTAAVLRKHKCSYTCRDTTLNLMKVFIHQANMVDDNKRYNAAVICQNSGRLSTADVLYKLKQYSAF